MIDSAHELDNARITKLLLTNSYGRSLSIYTELPSTNDHAKLAARGGAVHGSVVVADGQSQGRGSHGRQWTSPRGTDLYLSVIERRSIEVNSRPLIALAAALAVSEVVVKHTCAQPRLKWPNDVLIDGQKCSGMLVETWSGSGQTAYVIGIGLNVRRNQWSAELKPHATSLLAHTHKHLDRAEILADVLNHLEPWVDCLVRGEPHRLLITATQRLAWIGRRVTCGEVSGVLLGLSPRGELRIGTARSVRAMNSGSLRRVD